MHIDHVTIRTRDIAATNAFFQRVFDLMEGERPMAIRRIPGVWLFADGKPIVHIIGAQGYGIDRAAEAIDHVGFAMNGYAAFRAKLDALAIPYSPMDLADIGERRLFLHAPGGPLLEAVFSEPLPMPAGAAVDSHDKAPGN
jgi:catechol 2,3-dioxygenase-like lactoylglutathione lyase family enzyme